MAEGDEGSKGGGISYTYAEISGTLSASFRDFNHPFFKKRFGYEGWWKDMRKLVLSTI